MPRQPVYAIKALANHSLGSGDVTAGYTILTTEMLRAPAKRIADRMKELCGVDATLPENVVVLA